MASNSLPHSPRSKQSNTTFAERARRRYLSAASDNGSSRESVSAIKTQIARDPQNGIRSIVVEKIPQPSTLPTAVLMGAALLALELTNAATTFYALDSLMGSVGVYRTSFAMLLTFGLATLDAGGVYRLFSPATVGETNRSFGLWSIMFAWLLCATTNAALTWWAVSAAMAEHVTGNVVLSTQQLLDITPVFLALTLWLMRILLVAGWAQGERG